MADYDPHWICEDCEVHNHYSRKNCLGCDKPRPDDYKLKKRRLKVATDPKYQPRNYISYNQFRQSQIANFVVEACYVISINRWRNRLVSCLYNSSKTHNYY